VLVCSDWVPGKSWSWNEAAASTADKKQSDLGGNHNINILDTGQAILHCQKY
jgi:hypothetical protein